MTPTHAICAALTTEQLDLLTKAMDVLMAQPKSGAGGLTLRPSAIAVLSRDGYALIEAAEGWFAVDLFGAINTHALPTRAEADAFLRRWREPRLCD